MKALFNLDFSRWEIVLLFLLPALLNAIIFLYSTLILPQNRTNYTYSVFVLLVGLWQAGDGFVRLSPSAGIAGEWYRMSGVFALFFIPVGILFTLNFSAWYKSILNRVAFLTLFTPVVFCLIIMVGRLDAYTIVPSEKWSWIINPKPTFFTSLIYLWISMGALAILTILWWNYANARKEDLKRKQTLMLAAGFTVPVVIGVIVEIVFPLVLGLDDIPISSSLVTIFSVTSLVAIKRYSEQDYYSPLHQWDHIVESMKEGILIVDNDDRIMYANKTFCEISEYSFQEMEGKVAHQLLLLNPEEAGFEKVIEERKNKKEGAYELQLKSKSGKKLWVQINGSPYLDKDGKVIGSIGIQTDISERKAAQKQQQFDRNNLNALINNSNDLMWSVDKDFKLITSNRPFEEMVRVWSGQAIEKGDDLLMQGFPEDQMARYKKCYERAFAGEAFTEIEYTDNPAESWSEISYYPIRKENEVIGTACHSRDITERKRSEKYLEEREQTIKESNERYEMASKATNDVLWDWNIVTDKMYWSENFTVQFGYTSPSGEHAENDLWSRNIHPEDRERTLNGLAEQMADPRATIWKAEYRFYKKNKGLAYIRDNGHIVRDENGKAVRMVGAMIDITSQKVAEGKLLREQRKLKEAQAIAHVGSWELDFAGGTSTWSDEQCRIFGISPEENHQSFQSYLSFIHPDDRNFVEQEIENFRTTFINTSFSCRIILQDGTLKYIYTDCKSQLDHEGKSLRRFGITHDITEIKTAEEEREKMTNDLIARNKDLEQFAYIVSHNLRSSVANIIGFSDAMEYPDLPEDTMKEFRHGLSTSVKKLDNVISDLNVILEVKRNVSESKIVVNFSALTDDIKFSIDNIIKKERVKIVSNFTEIDQITTLKSYMYSIFYNLITNSIKYRRPDADPVIEIISRKLPAGIELVFKDNGMGIDLARNREQVFGLYKRFHRQVEGKGMGLFMTKTQVETLGGRIGIDSRLNEGTEFKLTFHT